MNQKLEEQIIREVKSRLNEAEARYGTRFPAPRIKFDLTGSAAGQFCPGKHPLIRFNPGIAENQATEFCNRTIPHEVSHLVVACLYHRPGTRPHGREWQQVMRDFGAEISRCHDYDLTGIPVRRQKRFIYLCNCRQHELSATRHNRVTQRGFRYLCRHCRTVLRCAHPS